MKPTTLLFAASLAANAVVLLGLAFRPVAGLPEFRNFFGVGQRSPSAAPASPAASDTARAASDAGARADTGLWSALHTSDLRAFAARLRAAGFSPTLVHAIVGAEIENQISARVRDFYAKLPPSAYWRPDRLNPLNSERVNEQIERIRGERTRLLRETLGDDRFATPGGLTGPNHRRLFGNLPPAKIDAIQRVNEDYRDMAAEIRAAANGMLVAEDQEKLALLERERRADLARALTPEEFADYDARNSPVTTRLAPALSLMGATEGEFLKIFGILSLLADQLFPSGPGADGRLLAQRDAQKQAADLLAAALGPERYAVYARSANPEFQQLARQVQASDVTMESAISAYNLRTPTTAEARRIYRDATLSYEQKLAALINLAQVTKAQVLGVLGPAVGNNYFRSAPWIAGLERGQIVTLGRDGQIWSEAMLPRAAAPAPPRK